MKLGSLKTEEIRYRLKNGGLRLSLAGFELVVHSSLPEVANGISLLYSEYPLGTEDGFTDFQIALDPPSPLRRWFRPQVNFTMGDHTPFKPLPLGQAFAMFEWGLNWVIANHCHQFAVVHSAVVEKNGKGIIFPGTPGSGKSTLCAALTCRGWRLLSDEMALISLRTGQIHPFPRPIGLKNVSIDIIRDFGENLLFGKTVHDTAKGDVAHLCPPAESVAAARITATPFAVVFPRYQQGAELEFRPVSKGQAMLQLAENCFNYPVLGVDGFNCLTDIADRALGHTLSYSRLPEAIAALDRLVEDTQ
ncbi:HprK-related kinase A [Dechloromonas sp. XY25]|uniref:HprK-related kinase A n=1 Tax=Dechloromonas hankyongensis TaxID=2908002 RepID=A0ABS9K3M4_9RHOO|nr:HprK-related kinase A [Dechloromonas hankyongensis]MCG2577777.1 HprK-related kinase A [Dechloromonas hankyongensis]